MSWLSPDGLTALTLSLKVAGWATAIGLPLALAVAYALARLRFPGRGLLNIAVHMPLIMPPVVTGYLLLLGFGPQGPLGRVFHDVFGLTFAFRWTGAALAAGVMGFPFMVRAIRLSLEAVDPRLEQAAATLGAPRFQVFRTITLPMIVPGLLAGAVLAFAKGMGEFGATITFVSNIPGQTQTLPLAIDLALETPGGEGQALRLALLSLTIAAAALVLSEWLSRRVAARIAGQTTAKVEEAAQI
ncbi:molybdate ABC transporter permease subunit [Rhodalgimonas zhirmunskyi]|uniref:Molybdenum transport system permease n=1 Tax=Rhodalgimonas zhirmunskyi TaxID=2964767 RepID=A0AAJ1UBW6_9RHOB|nr:molybdate ABC transporter permease subunit [Rhodoalgimonas zhirmunskyi]MDQ2095023.1 molybdate ABC transporter permease subunit [Rhodoalgimonas zhirmunskyi]